jgi:hypothetical protein
MMMAEKKTNGLTFLLDSRSQFFVTGMHNDRVALVFFSFLYEMVISTGCLLYNKSSFFCKIKFLI